MIEGWHITVAVLGLFVLGLVLIARRFRDAVLDKIALEPGEEVLFDDEPVLCELFPDKERMFRPYIRATTRRLLVAQGAILTSRKAMRFSIRHAEKRTHDGVGGGALQRGYVSFNAAVAVHDGRNGPQVEIRPEHPAAVADLTSWGIPGLLRIHSGNVDRYRELAN